LHYETASTTQQPWGEHRDTIKDCKTAGATTWQGQGNHTFTTVENINWVLSELSAEVLNMLDRTGRTCMSLLQ